MKVLHITPSSNGYEEVELIANRYSRKNQLTVISIDGEIHITGGLIIQDTPEIRSVLDSMPKDKHYSFVCSIKLTPFVELYYDEHEEQYK
jgi:hypothetical protein